MTERELARRAQRRLAVLRHVEEVSGNVAATCRYYERGLLRPGLDDALAAPYLKSIPDPLDGEGNIVLTQTPGLGLDIDWEYVAANRI